MQDFIHNLGNRSTMVLMGDKKPFYYNVALALPAMWKEHTYTYQNSEELSVGSVVLTPFGKDTKLGVVISEVEKPSYSTKEVGRHLNITMNMQSVTFLKWLDDYYPGTPGVSVQQFLPAFLKKETKPRTKKLIKHTAAKKVPPLTTGQVKAYKELIDNKQTSILHGITGSGKTRVYSELASTILKSGKNTLILYPEISLTSQLLENLSEYFGSENIVVYHSKQTPAQQREAWNKVYNNEKPMIVIGPRSALFLPYSELGLVIVDEAHENSYKQDSGTRYNGIIAASALAKTHGAQFIIGSATPPVQETHQILSKNGKLICVHDIAKKDSEVKKNFEVVDMTKKTNISSNYMLSKQLIDEIQSALNNNKQSLIFLNKRGTAKMIICNSCGWFAECPKCDMPLTHHHDSFTLQCHVCGFRKKSIVVCPECNNELSLKNPGVKAIEQEIMQLFPSARIARFDSDNNKKDSFHENYNQIRKGSADIIIGTQLITKGLDLPLLSVVGVLQADSSLLLPDYTSEERGFQQLTQVSGRVGRGHTNGKVIIQTYQPSNYVFPYVKDQNWHDFYSLEIEKREQNNYPPFTFAAKIWVTKTSKEKARNAASKFESALDKKNIRVLGPAPSFYEKSNNKYSWQIIILSSNRLNLTNIINKLPSDFYYDLDPVSFL
jgi:primosomal protein N' (replication factor Y)